jgi:hypothetical protein
MSYPTTKKLTKAKKKTTKKSTKGNAKSKKSPQKAIVEEEENKNDLPDASAPSSDPVANRSNSFFRRTLSRRPTPSLETKTEADVKLCEKNKNLFNSKRHGKEKNCWNGSPFLV